MPEIGVTTGNPANPRLKLFELEEGDFDTMLIFSGSLYHYWVRFDKDTATNKWRKMTRYDIKVSTSDANGEVKVTNVEKVSETTFTAPALPPTNEADGLYQIYYSTYDAVIPIPAGYHACYEQAKQLGRLSLRDKLLTALAINQKVPPDSSDPQAPILGEFLKTNNAFKLAGEGNDKRAEYTRRTLEEETDEQGNKSCKLGTEIKGLVAIAGMGLTDADDKASYEVFDAGVAIY